MHGARTPSVATTAGGVRLLAGHGRVVAAFASMGRCVAWVHRPTQPGWPVTLAANWPTQFGSATTRRREKTTPGLHPGSRCDGRVPEVDDDQPAALRGCGSPLASSRSSRSSAITQSLAMTQRMIRVGAQGSLARGEDDGSAADDP